VEEQAPPSRIVAQPKLNRGGASTADILDLAADVRARVHDAFGILLEPEPTLVGCALPAT